LDVFEHVSDATRILREVKLLRVLKHPDVVGGCTAQLLTPPDLSLETRVVSQPSKL
jgi:hypothetical protein